MKKDKLSIAYPNYDQYLNFSAPRDTEKWMGAVKNMYSIIHKGTDRLTAFNTVTAGWDNMEKLEFTHWLKYYEENSHKKYSSEIQAPIVRTAQVNYWEDINRAGYFVPIHQEPAVDTNSAEPAPIDFAVAVDPENDPITIENNKREIIEMQRGKILSRLDSAEKLLRTTDGHIMAGNELASLMRAIYDLKERIHVVNKKSSSTKLYEDMIVREANVLVRKGFIKASAILCKIADGENLTATSPANPLASGGLPGIMPSEAPGQVPPPNNPPDEEDLSEGMKGFLEGLDTNNFTPDAEILEVQDNEDDELVVEAQVATPPPVPTVPNKPVAQKAEIEVEEDKAPTTGDKNFDSMIDSAFHSLTVQDVVNKLEDLAKIFKTREVPRQLAIVDMMLDKLGLASFFPTLAEAMNRSLDSNQYMSSRVEDILSKLRGTIETRDIDLKNENAVDNPAVAGIKQQLETNELKEKNRKEQRKQQENAEADQAVKGTPEIEVEEDLGQPTEMTQKVPAVAPPSAAPPPPVR